MIVGKGAGGEGDAITKTVMPQLFALPIKKVEIEIVQMGAPQSGKPRYLAALIVDRHEEPLRSVTKTQRGVLVVNFFTCAIEEGLQSHFRAIGVLGVVEPLHAE